MCVKARWLHLFLYFYTYNSKTTIQASSMVNEEDSQKKSKITQQMPFKRMPSLMFHILSMTNMDQQQDNFQ